MTKFSTSSSSESSDSETEEIQEIPKLEDTHSGAFLPERENHTSDSSSSSSSSEDEDENEDRGMKMDGTRISDDNGDEIRAMETQEVGRSSPALPVVLDTSSSDSDHDEDEIEDGSRPDHEKLASGSSSDAEQEDNETHTSKPDEDANSPIQQNLDEQDPAEDFTGLTNERGGTTHEEADKNEIPEESSSSSSDEEDAGNNPTIQASSSSSSSSSDDESGKGAENKSDDIGLEPEEGETENIGNVFVLEAPPNAQGGSRSVHDAEDEGGTNHGDDDDLHGQNDVQKAEDRCSESSSSDSSSSSSSDSEDDSGPLVVRQNHHNPSDGDEKETMAVSLKKALEEREKEMQRKRAEEERDPSLGARKPSGPSKRNDH